MMIGIDYLGPTVTGICVALGLVHLGSGLHRASLKVNLSFALIVFLMAVFSLIEWRSMHANSPAEYLARLRWQDSGGSAVAMALAIFVRTYFGVGRGWLLVAAAFACAVAVTRGNSFVFHTPSCFSRAVSSRFLSLLRNAEDRWPNSRPRTTDIADTFPMRGGRLVWAPR